MTAQSQLCGVWVVPAIPVPGYCGDSCIPQKPWTFYHSGQIPLLIISPSLTVLYLCACVFLSYSLKALSAKWFWVGWEPNWNEEQINWHWGDLAAVPNCLRAWHWCVPPSLCCPPSPAVNHLMGRGKLSRQGLWFLACHLGSCVREVFVTQKKNELERSEVNKP